MTFLLLLVVCFVCACYLWRSNRRRMLQLSSLTPTMKGCLPLVGNALAFNGDSQHIWEMFKKVMNEANEAGGVLAVWFGPSLHYMITDPDDAYAILHKCLEKNRYMYGMASNILGSSFLSADVSKWKRSRKLFNPSFSQHMLNQFNSIFNMQARNLVKDLIPLAGQGETSIFAQISDVAMNTLCMTVLGISESNEAVVDRGYIEAQKKMFSLLAKRFSNILLHPDIIFNLSNLKKEEDELVKIVHRQSSKVIAQRKKERGIESQNKNTRTTTEHRFRSFLDLLLDLDEKDHFEDHEVRDDLTGIIVAGHDALSTAFYYTLMLLGSFPEVQDKLYKEVLTVVGTNDDVNSHHHLPYLDAVYKECLRLYPPFPVSSRDCDEEIKLKNYTLPAGCHCTVGIWQIQRLPVWGPDAELFRPERWLEPDTLPTSPGAFCTFSIGKRNCIGKYYGTMLNKTSLVHVIRKFRIKADISQLKFKMEVLMKPTSENHLVLELRDSV